MDACAALVQAANPNSIGSSLTPYGSGEECREDEGDAFIVDATLCFGPCPIASGFKGPKGPQGDAGCPACEIKTPKDDIEWKYDDDPCPDTTTTAAPTTTCDPNDPNCVPVTTPAPDNCWECKKTYSIETGSGGIGRARRSLQVVSRRPCCRGCLGGGCCLADCFFDRDSNCSCLRTVYLISLPLTQGCRF